MSILLGVNERLREHLEPERANVLFEALDQAVGAWLCDLQGHVQDVAYRYGLNEPGSLWVMGLVQAALYGGNVKVAEETPS